MFYKKIIALILAGSFVFGQVFSVNAFASATKSKKPALSPIIKEVALPAILVGGSGIILLGLIINSQLEHSKQTDFDQWINILSGKNAGKSSHNGEKWCYTSADQFRKDSDENLENYHNYIQVIFPNCDPGMANHDLIVNDEFRKLWNEKVAKDPSLPTKVQQQMRLNFIRMLKFWGYKVDGDKNGIRSITFDSAPEKAVAYKKKVDETDHNNLRITRVLIALRLFGLNHEAQLFWNVLQQSSNKYSKSFWLDAVATKIDPVIKP